MHKDLTARIAAYHDKHPGGGELHIYIEDGNIEAYHIEACMLGCKEKGDTEGEQLCRDLLLLSRRERYEVVPDNGEGSFTEEFLSDLMHFDLTPQRLADSVNVNGVFYVRMDIAEHMLDDLDGALVSFLLEREKNKCSE